MRIISFVSSKGGVGKTTVIAHLATALARRGETVLAVDFDPQNALGLHLGLGPEYAQGFVRHWCSGQPWADAAFRNTDGVGFLSFGEINLANLKKFDDDLQQEEDWLATKLLSIDLPDSTTILIDTPTLPSPYALQALRAANMVIALQRAEAASYLSLTRLESLLHELQSRNASSATPYTPYILLNYLDSTRRLCNDILALTRNRFGQHFIPYPIHRDTALQDAFASDSYVLDFAPQSQAAHDIHGLASWLLNQVNHNHA